MLAANEARELSLSLRDADYSDSRSATTESSR